MHKQVTMLLSAGSTPGKLAMLGKALGLADPPINIRNIGGAEWRHHGPITLMIDTDSDADMVRFAGIMLQLQIEWLSFRTVEVRLPNAVGQLGRATDAIGNINIYGVLLLGSEGDDALVGLGLRVEDVPLALSRLAPLASENPPITARLLEHPDEPGLDPDQWDTRTASLLPLWEADRFFELGPPSP